MEIIIDRLEEEKLKLRPFGNKEDEEGPRCGISCLAFVLSYKEAEKLRTELNKRAG